MRVLTLLPARKALMGDDLGVGRNMVSAIRYWLQATGLAVAVPEKTDGKRSVRFWGAGAGVGGARRAGGWAAGATRSAPSWPSNDRGVRGADHYLGPAPPG